MQYTLYAVANAVNSTLAVISARCPCVLCDCVLIMLWRTSGWCTPNYDCTTAAIHSWVLLNLKWCHVSRPGKQDCIRFAGGKNRHVWGSCILGLLNSVPLYLIVLFISGKISEREACKWWQPGAGAPGGEQKLKHQQTRKQPFAVFPLIFSMRVYLAVAV